MVKFVDILQTMYKTYNVDFCYVADSIGIDDDVVKEWEEEKRLPTKEELKKFSDLFAIPMDALEKSIKSSKTE